MSREERVLKRRIFTLQVGVTAVAVSAAVVHLVSPGIKIDGVLLGLLGVALLPWLGFILQSLELPGGIKLTYRNLERRLEETRQKLEVTQGEVASTRNRVNFAESGGVPDLKSDSPEGEWRQLIDRYNTIRTTMKSGPIRTQAMTDVVRHLTILAGRLDAYDWQSALRSNDGGERVAAYAYLYARPIGTSVEELVSALTHAESTPFGQYWAILALEKCLPGKTASLQNVEYELRKYLADVPVGSDRYFELSRLLAVINDSQTATSFRF